MSSSWMDDKLDDIPDKLAAKREEEVSPKAAEDVVKVAPPQREQNGEFVIEPMTSQSKTVFTFFGHKGVGKTALAFYLPGKKLCLSFDRKSAHVKENPKLFNNDPSITVIDARKYFDQSVDSLITQSADSTYRYINAILDKYEADSYDWVIFDGVDIYVSIMEQYMRYKKKLGPYQGFAELVWWKIRRAAVEAIHNKAYGIVNKGIVYNTYIRSEKVIEEGGFELHKEIPNWIGIIMHETDIVGKCWTEFEEKTTKFMCRIITSKKDHFIETGTTQDVTGKGLKFLRKL